GRLPQPVANLIVKRLHLARLDDVRVVSQPVKELRSVSLWIDRLQFDVLDERLALRPGRLRVNVEGPGPFEDAGHAAQWTEVSERIDVDVGWFGVDIHRRMQHGRSLTCAGASRRTRP